MTRAQASAKDRWLEELSRRVESGNDLEFSLAQLARQMGEDDVSGLSVFLSNLVESEAVTRFTVNVCPISQCGRPLPVGVESVACPFCGTDYQEEGIEPTTEIFFRLIGEVSRDIRWMIVIHGMNSRAPWQERFSWEIANRLKYSAPVLIYKYGWATIEVLLVSVHHRLAKRLGQRIRIAIEQARAAGLPDRPDVIAHSFGTRLLSLVLEDSDFSDIKLGRVITAGSIIRPDFDWQRQLNSGRVEAVLNHVAAQDGSVPFAQWCIPGSGPGGKVGYSSRATLNVRNDNFGHSSFFEERRLSELIGDGGLWHSFLTRPLRHYAPAGAFIVERPWKNAPAWLRWLARLVACVLFFLFLPISFFRRLLDP